MSLLDELNRRNVTRVAIAYVAGAWLVIQVVETLFPLFGLADSLARMIIIILGIGFMPVLVFSWVFEFTSEGLKKESEIDRSRPSSQTQTKTFDRMIIAVLMLAVAYFAVDKFILAESRIESARQEGRSDAMIESFGDNSIAVLPFADMSPGRDQEYMSDGIAEELLNLLSKVPDLRVISRSSSFSFKDKDVDVPTIAEELHVANILEGSVRKAGDQIRITAQLIDGRSDSHLWSESYDRVLDDVFAIQDEIAKEVVSQLKLTLLGVASGSVETTPEAYDQYLLGQHLMHERTKASLEGAVEHFQHAIELDPDYSPAHAGLAISSMLLIDSSSTYGDLSLEEAVSRALPPAERALELEPELAEAHAAVGFIHYKKEEFDAALRFWDTALEINPNFADVHSWRGVLLQSMGRYRQSFTSRQAAADLDPLSVSVLNNYAVALFSQSRHAESKQVLERMKAISPPSYYYMSSWQAYQRGEPANALFFLLDGYDFDPENRRIPQGLANMFGLMGIHEESVRHSTHSIRWLPYLWQADFETMLEIAREDHDENPDNRYFNSRLGIALLATGEVEAAMSYLDRYLAGFDNAAWTNINIAGYVALNRQASGDKKGTAVILDELRSRYDRSVAGGIDDNPMRRLRMMISLIEGRQDDGLDAIDALSKGSGIEPDVAVSLRTLTPLVNDSRFDETLERQSVRWAGERDKMLTRICNEERWVEWDPLPDTCDR